MKFHSYEAAYYDAKRLLEKEGKRSFTLQEFEKVCISYFNRTNAPSFERMRLLSEIWWIEENKPYYKFYPSILEPAKRLNLKNIPVNLLAIPGKNKTVTLWFPEGNRIQNILVSQIREDRLFFCIRVDIEEWQYAFFVCNLKSDSCIDDVVENCYIDESCTISYTDEQNALIKEAVRYFAMSKFLTDCPNEDLMSHDLPGRYIRDWGKASNKRKKEILDWSKRHGHNGYNIGLHARIVENAGRLSEPRENEGTGKEQEYAHIRTGHIHAVRFGPEKKHVKLQWYMPIVVNKDKPFKVSDNGT